MNRDPIGNSQADRLCLAIDLDDENEIMRIVHELKDVVGYFKVNSAFTLFGPPLIRAILGTGAKVFLDLKLHDIPNTVRAYGEAVSLLGVHIVTVHVAGGRQMLQEFVRGSEEMARARGVPRPRLVGITILTSIDETVMNQEMNVQGAIQDEVLRRGKFAAESGLDGIVCSAGELAYVRPKLPSSFYYVTPGVRPAGSGTDDHKRPVTYAEAISAGSNLLVVGRSITGAKDPRSAVEALHNEMRVRP